jgi:hypothetical protein
MKLIIIFLFSCVVVVGQTSNDLRQKYGKPKSETFQIRSDVDMTVTYRKNGTVCTMLLEPTPYWLGAAKLDEDSSFIKMSVVKKIFDELVPKERRGSLVSGPREGHVQWVYEKVSLVIDGQTDAARRAAIVMSSSDCK